MRTLFTILIVLAARLAAAQTPIAGTLTWDQTRAADLKKYVLTDNGGPVQDLGLPATNSAPVALTPGTHAIVLSACYADLACEPTKYTVIVGESGAGISYTDLTPADGLSIRNGTAVTMSVTATDDSGLRTVTGYWSLKGGPFDKRATQKAGNTFKWTETPSSGAGRRDWYFVLEANDGEKVQTPTRMITVTATKKTQRKGR